jgi:death on curing protein
MDWEWVLKTVVLSIHEMQLAEHGGDSGLRDEGLLHSALARPQNLLACGENPDVADLAAAYTFDIARNHPFVDGNKRAAFIILELFLEQNGWTLNADDETCVTILGTVASDGLSESAFAAWIRDHLIRS